MGRYHEFMNPLKDFTDEQLADELDRRYQAQRRKKDREAMRQINFDITKLSARYEESEHDDGEYDFSFSIMHEGIGYCIYYDNPEHKGDDEVKYPAWWPVNSEGSCGVHLFLPRGFSEECENSYRFDGSLKKALETLKKAGITDVAPADHGEYQKWRAFKDKADEGK